MNLLDVSFKDLERVVEQVVSSQIGKNIKINIHLTTEFGEKENMKGGATGSYEKREFDILIAGDVKLRNVVKVIAHEAAHIVLKDEGHGDAFSAKMKELEETFIHNALKECVLIAPML